MRVGILTSDQIRHRFLANTVAAQFDVPLVLAEGKARNPARCEGEPEEQELLEEYFKDRAASETEILADGLEWNRGRIGEVVSVPAGDINDLEWTAKMCEAKVDLIAVFGSSLLRQAWLRKYSGRLVNIHLGLSPYYRGSGTNFWPLVNEEPEYVGATIHLIDAGVDSGAILQHARPHITNGDTPHSIGNKAIKEGASALCWALREYHAGAIQPVPQWNEPEARHIRFRDFNPTVLKDLLTRWESGLLDWYLADAEPRRARVRLVREALNA